MRSLLAALLRIADACALRPIAPQHTSMRRRELVSFAAAAAAVLPSAALATGNMPAVQGKVTTMDGAVKKASTPEAAKKQIAAGYDELGKLLDNFEAVIVSGGGDGVRRSLGVVGTESPIYLIEPAFRLLFEADESLPMEYIEKVESLMRNLSSADSEAYSAIFIESSSMLKAPRAGLAVSGRLPWHGCSSMLILKRNGPAAWLFPAATSRVAAFPRPGSRVPRASQRTTSRAQKWRSAMRARTGRS